MNLNKLLALFLCFILQNIKAQDFEHHLSVHLEAGKTYWSLIRYEENEFQFNSLNRMQYQIKWKFIQAGLGFGLNYSLWKDKTKFSTGTYVTKDKNYNYYILPQIGFNVKNVELNVGCQFNLYNFSKFIDYYGDVSKNKNYFGFTYYHFWTNIAYSIKLNENFNLKPQMSCLFHVKNLIFYIPSVGIGLDWKIPRK